MAPATRPRDLEPELDKCFSGEQHLISWDAACAALADPAAAARSVPLHIFLHDEANVAALSSPWKPFPDPSPQERARFDAKTAPVSVAPAAAAHYDVDEIKRDALWLSHTARLSEYVALRQVLLEWQSRPHVQLLSGFTDDEALSVNDAAGVANFGASAFNASIITAQAAPADGHFDSDDQRRLRILQQYFSARTAILRTSQLLISWGGSLSFNRRSDGTCDEEWLEKLGQEIAANQNPRDADAVNQCIQAVNNTWASLDEGLTWDIPDSIRDAVAEKWLTAQVTGLVHVLHIGLLHADLFIDKYVPAATIESWFTSIADKLFFANFDLPPQLAELGSLLHLLTSLFSLSLLKMDCVLDDLASGRYTSWEPSCYLLDEKTVDMLSMIFGQAKFLGPSPATPPAFAWAIISWRLTAEGDRVERGREKQVEDGSVSSLPAKTSLERVVLALTRLEGVEIFEGKQPFQDIAESCSNAGVLQIVMRFVELIADTFGTPIDRTSRDRFRFLLLYLVRGALSSKIIDYEAEVVVCAHLIMTGGRDFLGWKEDAASGADLVTSFCLHDKDVLGPLLIDEARMRYPYELTPILRFSSALARGEKAPEDRLPLVAADLAAMPSLMQRLPPRFSSYQLILEEENANWVELADDLPLFATLQRAAFGNSRRLVTNGSGTSQLSMAIPCQTRGNIVDEREQPYIALWRYDHSALDYLLKLLSTITAGSSVVESSSEEKVSTADAADIVGFIADLLHSSLRGQDKVCSTELLAALRMGPDHGHDTISTILAILDQELLHLCQDPGKEDSLDLLVHCMHVLHALVSIAPNRVWPWLSRSRLLEASGNGGSLATILLGTEVVLGRYDFLISCIGLFQLLVDDAVERAVSRKAANKALTRFNSAATSDSGSSDKSMSSTLLNFGRTLATVYEGALNWPFQNEADRMLVNIGICNAFDAVLNYAYGADDVEAISGKLTSIVAPVATYLTELYLSNSDNGSPSNPMLTSLLVGAKTRTDTFARQITQTWQKQTQATLCLCNTLIRVANLLGKPWTHLEQQMFKATPLLARLYAVGDQYKTSVVTILRSLVRGAVREGANLVAPENTSNKTSKEPPSLLGHLGAQTSKNFLAMLSHLDEPLKTAEIQIQVWDFLSAVLTCKQQWLALYLLTGTTPRESAKGKSSAAQRHKALHTRALEAITKMDLARPNQNWALYAAMLDFVSAAQNNWAWAGDLRQHPDFVKALLAFLRWLAIQPIDEKSLAGNRDRAFQNTMAATASEILAMHVHNLRQRGEDVPLKDIVPALAVLDEHAVSTPSYRISLHSRLQSSFEKQFHGVSIARFKRTSLRPASFGVDFFYDVDLAGKLLHFDSSWSGPRAPGFSDDVKRANLNLGLVESQIRLLNAWKTFASELVLHAAVDERLSKILVRAVKKCMASNADSSLPDALFGQLNEVRADLAFILTQRLAGTKIGTKESREMLTSIWTAIRAAATDFDTIFSSNVVHYYRSLLRILYLALQLLSANSPAVQDATSETFRGSFGSSMPKSTKEFVEPISSLLLEILSDVVARGFRSLATQIHTDSSTIYPSDFAILTAILQTILAVPEMVTWHAQAALLFANSGTVRYAVSLFSWSDRLAVSNAEPQDNPYSNTSSMLDPVYGELSLHFILTLSTLPALSEQMAVEGLLSNLSSAPLMSLYQRPNGISPFDRGPPPRLFNIWAKGILPLCLNLLRNVGPPIAGEVSAFLGQFESMLGRAGSALNSRSSQTKICLSLAMEAHSLALIDRILDQIRTMGPRVGVQPQDIPVLNWDRESVKEDIDLWVSRRVALRDAVIALNEADARLAGQIIKHPREQELPEYDDRPEDLLEERVAKELVAAGECMSIGNGSA